MVAFLVAESRTERSYWGTVAKSVFGGGPMGEDVARTSSVQLVDDA